ncbi:NADH-quinone oxidoreductase subunit M [Kamptonema cortianum]|nr:NADH-quinone oxidoreductase subunit M [Geitlerinema splendidum]MDK3162511.1 NADH-quinone oxidoreductase subunit M [Kamptonema cortianum]
MSGLGPITGMIAIPLIGMVLLMLVPDQYVKAIRWLTVLFTTGTLLASLNILNLFSQHTFHFQMVEMVPWIPAWNINYKVGIDGISIWLVVLTSLLTLLSVIFSFYVNKRPKLYFIMLLLLEAAMLGVFVSLDMILFYMFFEATLIPMAIMIYVWGGSNRNYAAIKFFIYTFAASIFMLLGMIVLASRYAELNGGMLSFDIAQIQAMVATGEFWRGADGLQTLIFWAFTIAFLVKCPMFPFHTWLPDAHTEAPTAGSIILAGVLLKMGTYGLLRFCMPLFPDAALQAVPILVWASIIGIIYGAIVAAMQTDVKKLVAYSSVAHMGFIVYGLFTFNQMGMMGGAYQQLNHGISTGALFLLIGLLYERTHNREFKKMGGLKAQMPIFAALFLLVMLSSVGLPGLNGFVGEFLAMAGAFYAAVQGHYGLNLAMPFIAGTGVILAAVYLLWMFQKVFYGPITNPDIKRLKDLKPWEIGLVGVFVVFIFWGGLYPNTFLKPMEKSINATRLMVINPPHMRPNWVNKNLEISDQGDLVEVTMRNADGSIDKTAIKHIHSLNQYYTSPVAMKFDPPEEAE